MDTGCRAILGAFVFLFWARAGCAQTADKSRAIPQSSCQKSDHTFPDFEHDKYTENGANENYTVHSSTVYNPFDFLPWVKAKDEGIAQDIANLVGSNLAVKKPFQYSTAVAGALKIIEDADVLPNASPVRVRVWLEVVTISCAGSKVDLVYHLYSTQVLPSASGTPEGQVTERQTPQNTAGLTESPSSGPLQSKMTPSIGFDLANKLCAGGQLSSVLGNAKQFQFRLLVQGQGSQKMSQAHVSLEGSRDSHGKIIHQDMRINFDDSSLPTGMGSLRQLESSAQYAATSQPFFGGNVSARFGGLAEQGHQQTDVRVPVSLETLTASRVNALKLYAGLDSRLPENVFSASFGLEIGSTGFFSRPWRKYIGDVRHEYWHTLGDHHLFDLESRVTAGGLQFDSQIPLTERFFGGSYEQMFVPDDSWQIRSNPVIRAIPGSRLYETAAGAGATSFVGLNLTAAIGIWRRPLVPAELNKDQEFQGLLEGQLKTATSMAQLHYSASDEHFKKMVAELPGVIGSIKSLQGAVGAAEAAHPGSADEFKLCKSAMNMASRRATDSQSGADYQQYGRISALLKADPHEDRLDKVIAACGTLNTSLGAAGGLTGPLNAVDQERQTLETEFKGIDQTAAADKAKAEMAFVRRTLKTLFKDMNLYSISPVFIFDTVRIGPSGPGVQTARYGPGGGLRLELANSVNFTVGYARNVSPGPGEGSNAVFFTIGVRDLFH